MAALRNMPTWAIAAAVVALIAIGAFGWWLLSPLVLAMTAEEECPFAADAMVPDGTTRADVEMTMATMAKVDSPAEEAMPAGMAEPGIVKTGQFRDGDRFHKGSGTASIYRLADGSHVLRLETLDVTNGPALVVLLSPHPDPTNRLEATQAGYVELAKLKGNKGNQNYPLPDDVDPAAFGSVVIYCKPFQVVFSVAPLAEEE